MDTLEFQLWECNGMDVWFTQEFSQVGEEN